MILRSLLIALRHAFKFKTYSLINLGGLALGLSSSIIILQFVSEEFSYDRFHHSVHNVYRLNTVSRSEQGIQVQAAGTPLLAPTLMSDLPEVEAAVRLRHADDVLVEVGEQKFYETRVFYADSNFFKVLSFPLAKGNPHTALKKINTAVITTEFARKYFGDEDPLNKTIVVSKTLLQVTGVTAPTGKSHFEFDILISFETFTPPRGTPATLTSWAWTSFPTYVRLHEGSDRASVEAKFPAFISRYRSPEDAPHVSYQLQPIQEVYLHSRNIHERDGISTKGDYLYTVGLAAIAVVIMGIACFNFANLSTALAIYRVKETGVKRSLGSNRTDIFFQFMLESIVSATIGLLLGILLHLVATALELMPGANLSLAIGVHLKWMPFYVLLVVLMGSFTGLYPAILLSRLTAPEALKGRNTFGRGGSKVPLRKAIIVFQFFVTTVLITASLTIKKQMDFVQSKSLGYNKEGIIVVHLPDDQMRNVFPTLRNKLMEHVAVLGVSASRDLFDGQQGTTDVIEAGSSEEPHAISMFRIYPNFIETMGIKMLMGKSFQEPLTDSTAFVLNEAAVKMLGWDQNEVLGRRLYSYFQSGEVIGVVEDFHFASLHAAVTPLIMLVPKSKVEYLYIRVALGDLHQTLGTLESDWKSIVPHLPFDYIMLDEHVGEMYRQERRFSRLTFIFCGLSVVLACLGLFGITSLMTESRTKEICIRKVLGASVSRITALLTKDLVLLVLLAAAIALPVSSYLLERWLQGFAYKIDVSPGLLMVAVIMSLTLAGVAVGFKAVIAARANPVDLLKSE
ncbi:MAG TPA: ABC transporter permease [Chryseolinea sp.]|nr:ABC transporter permease [Chryseolinea sp.]